MKATQEDHGHAVCGVDARECKSFTVRRDPVIRAEGRRKSAESCPVRLNQVHAAPGVVELPEDIGRRPKEAVRVDIEVVQDGVEG